MTSEKKSKASEAEHLLVEAERYEEAGDFKRAFRCYFASAQLGDSSGQINLGNYYANGTGVRKSIEEAARWYKKAYRAGERCGALNLAIDRRNAGRARSAVIWFKKAIAMNDGEACIELAKIYAAMESKQGSAIELLEQALLMSPTDISDSGREEAESLLREIEASRARAVLSSLYEASR
jgi:TPR repeat protein